MYKKVKSGTGSLLKIAYHSDITGKRNKARNTVGIRHTSRNCNA